MRMGSVLMRMGGINVIFFPRRHAIHFGLVGGRAMRESNRPGLSVRALAEDPPAHYYPV